MIKTVVRSLGLIVISMAVLWGCSKSRQMMPTPNVYLTEEGQHYQDLNPELQSSEVRLFYDRTTGRHRGNHAACDHNGAVTE